MKRQILKILENINKGKVASDLPQEFEKLFGFIVENPNSRTAKNFFYYHSMEKNSPVCEDGSPDFTYLIGEEFLPENWIAEDDRLAWEAFLASQV